MLECCILFLHHQDDPTTRAHLDLLRRLNPYPVVAISEEAVAPLPGSFDVARPEWGYAGSTWFNADLPMCRWYNHGGLRAERYVLTEWDTHASLPVREFFDEVWDADAAARCVKIPEVDPHWNWYSELGRLPPELRPFAAGFLPLGCALISDRALGALAATAQFPEVYSELRIGTLLRHAGFTLTPLPRHRASTVDWLPDLIQFDPDRPAIYHPVKHFDPVRPARSDAAADAVGASSRSFHS